MIFGREPAIVVGAINALIALAVGFGLDVTPEQVGLINAAAAAVLAVVVRQQVVPLVTHEEHLDHLVTITAALPDPDTERTTGAPDEGQSVLVVAAVSAVVCVILLLAFDLIHIG